MDTLITPEVNAVITTIVGILISVFTTYLAHKVKQRDEEMIRYRQEREEKEAADAKAREEREKDMDLLTIGMARTMLLNNYEKCIEKGYYSVSEREVYHKLYKAYSGAKQNGIIDEIAEKIVDLPTEPPKKGDENL